MPDLALALEAAVAAALLALGLAGLTGRPRFASSWALAACGVGAAIDLAFLLAGAPPARIALPIGLPGAGLWLALDGLSGFFLLIVLLAGAAASGAAPRAQDGAGLVAPWLGAMMLTLLAGDGFALLLGLALGVLLAATQGARLQVAVAMPSLFALIAAMALLAPLRPWGFDLSFAAMRSHAPEGARAVLVLLLALLGAGGLAGLAPFHVWLAPAHAAAPAPVAAAMTGAGTRVALYVLARLLFDLVGPAQPGWWGVPLILAGAAGAVLGMLRALIADDIRAAIAGVAGGSTGMVAVGLGVALAARAADLPGVAALALGGALLLALADALLLALLLLGAGAVEEAAGTRRLSRLGGLIQRMPLATLPMLAGAASFSGLPPSAGFAARWTLLQAVLAAPRIGGLALSMLMALTAAALGLAVALAAAAAVRLIGIGWLGRPRTPRAAAAQEAPLPVRAALLALAGGLLLFGLFPGLGLRLARPALVLAVDSGMAGRVGPFAITARAGAPGYAAPVVALLLALALALVWAVVRQRSVPGHRIAPAWDGGFAAPPPWLPFGDPLTQMGSAGFGRIVLRTLGPTLLAARGRDPALVWLVRPLQRLRSGLSARAARMQSLDVRGMLGLAAAALVVLLLAVALIGQG